MQKIDLQLFLSFWVTGGDDDNSDTEEKVKKPEIELRDAARHLEEENADHLPHRRPLMVVRVGAAQTHNHQPLHLLPVEVRAQPLVRRLQNDALPVEIPTPSRRY
ncbi:unnamed protein product [Spirodela intermedia]|uniref:Uncharacterized protein n=1 Tax=Spirodela intermedia TaxID=51605 RepID=A0ABN7EBR5_SPIIN|nr:unnamed protein product [Spirodela intermedia]